MKLVEGTGKAMRAFPPLPLFFSSLFCSLPLIWPEIPRIPPATCSKVAEAGNDAENYHDASVAAVDLQIRPPR